MASVRQRLAFLIRASQARTSSACQRECEPLPPKSVAVGNPLVLVQRSNVPREIP